MPTISDNPRHTLQGVNRGPSLSQFIQLLFILRLPRTLPYLLKKPGHLRPSVDSEHPAAQIIHTVCSGGCSVQEDIAVNCVLGGGKQFNRDWDYELLRPRHREMSRSQMTASKRRK